MPEGVHPDWRAVVRASDGAVRLDPDVLDEVVEHAEELYREQRALGRTGGEARAAVEAELADLPAVARAAQASRRRRLAPAPEPPAGRSRHAGALGQDLRYGARLLASRPWVTAIAIVTLALGIGANTAIFSIVDRLLLAPLPFPNPDRLVMLWEQDVKDPDDLFIVSAPNWQDWTARSRSFSHTAIWEYLRFNLSGGAEPEQVFGLRVSSSAFPMLGIAPQLGRTFTAAEDAPGHEVVLISDAVWHGRFQGRRDVIGQLLRVNGRPHEVVGVMPPSFVFPTHREQVWVPIAFNTQDAERGSHSFFAAARLNDGVTFEAARAELEAVGRRLADEYPDANEGEGASLTAMAEYGVRYMKPTLYALAGAVAFVLLIACVNVANLLLAQTGARQREFAVRAALGAARSRLVAQLIVEGVLLSMAGGVLGALLAWAATAALAQQLPPGIRLAPFRGGNAVPLDVQVLAFTALVSIGTGVLFSLAPAFTMARHEPAGSLKAGGDRGGTARVSRVRAVLVSVEVALAVVVLAAAGLMLKSVSRLAAVDPGLSSSNVLVMEMALPQEDFYGPPVRTSFCADLGLRVSKVPGVVSVGAVSHLPLSGANAGRGVTIEGGTAPPDQSPSGFYRLTCPGYFATLGIPLRRGRDFTDADATTAHGVAIVNEAMAAKYWPAQDPIGRRFRIGGPDSTNRWLTVVGVAGNVRHFGLDSEAQREFYRPYSQAAWPQMTITVRTEGPPLLAAASVRGALRQIDPDQPVTGIRSMEEVTAESIGPRRFTMLLLGLFSVVALSLAAIGVYGVVSFVVSQRSREIGIRMALGARAGQVVRLVVGRSLVPVAVGILVGVAGALWASRPLQAMLFGVTPQDPFVLAAIVGILGGSAVLACLVPARRAALVDPLVVLKEE